MRRRGRRLTVRMPEALYADISDEALRREHSVNAEILRRCMLKRWSNQAAWGMGYRYQSPPRQDLIDELPGSIPF